MGAKGTCASSQVARYPCGAKSDGAALILVLVCLLALAGLVMSSVAGVYEKVRNIRYLREEYRADVLAKSGLEIAKFLLSKDIDPLSDTQQEPWATPWKAGAVTVRIVPCNARINLNLILEGAFDDEQENRVYRAAKSIFIKNKTKVFLLDILRDWIDGDKKERIFGSESFFYSSMFPLYYPRNSFLKTIEEVFLVSGWDKIDKKIIYDNFTVCGKSEKLNINFVNEAVFKNYFPEIEDLWPKVSSTQMTTGFAVISELQDIINKSLSAKENASVVLNFATETSDLFEAIVEVDLPFVYEKRRYVLRREYADKVPEARALEENTLVVKVQEPVEHRPQ